MVLDTFCSESIALGKRLLTLVMVFAKILNSKDGAACDVAPFYNGNVAHCQMTVHSC